MVSGGFGWVAVKVAVNFITKNLRKAIMERSKLRKRCLHERIDQAKGLYYNKINLCVSILRKNKRGNVENKIVSGS